MLVSRLIAAAGGGDGTPEFVGGYAEGFVGQTSSKSISLTSLTGGSGSQPQAGDLVLVLFGVGATSGANVNDYPLIDSASGSWNMVAIGGNTEIQEVQYIMSYRRMGATPDTTFNCVFGTGNVAWAGSVAVHVWRNLDGMPVEIPTQSGSASAKPNPPSVTPALGSSAIIFGIGAGAHLAGTQTFTSSNLSNFVTAGANDTTDVTVGMGTKEWTSGAFDPAEFGFTGTDSATYAADAWTGVWYPASERTHPYLQNVSEAIDTSVSTLTIDRPYNARSGDLLYAIVITDATSPTFVPPTGWTSLIEHQYTTPTPDEYLWVCYKELGGGEPASYDFDATASGNMHGAIIQVRQGTHDVVGTVSESSSALGITVTNNDSLLLCLGFTDTAPSSYVQELFGTTLDGFLYTSSATTTLRRIRVLYGLKASGATGDIAVTAAGPKVLVSVAPV